MPEYKLFVLQVSILQMFVLHTRTGTWVMNVFSNFVQGHTIIIIITFMYTFFCNIIRILFIKTSLSCIVVLEKINIIISIIVVIIIDSLKSSLILNMSTKHYISALQNIIKHSNPDQYHPT